MTFSKNALFFTFKNTNYLIMDPAFQLNAFPTRW